MVTSSASALIISEVELNPEGNDRDNEWIEFYNEGEINLEGYEIVNNDGGRLNLSGSYNGYFVLQISGQWLDNSDEKIILVKDNETLDETDLLEDSGNGNNNMTWQFCDSGWVLKESSRGEENNCGSESQEEEMNETQTDEDEISDETEEVQESERNRDEPDKEVESPKIVQTSNVTKPKKEKILLNAETNEKKEISREVTSEGWIIENRLMIFSSFCLVITLLVLFRLL